MLIRFNKRGFTLVEIMIVVAIIGILAAIAIPNLMRARISANEAMVKHDLWIILAAMESYATANNSNYPNIWADLTDAIPPYIEASFKDPVNGKNGYVFSQFTHLGPVNGVSNKWVVATPIKLNVTGTNYFCVDQAGIMKTYSDAQWQAVVHVADCP